MIQTGLFCVPKILEALWLNPDYAIGIHGEKETGIANLDAFSKALETKPSVSQSKIISKCGYCLLSPCIRLLQKVCIAVSKASLVSCSPITTCRKTYQIIGHHDHVQSCLTAVETLYIKTVKTKITLEFLYTVLRICPMPIELPHLLRRQLHICNETLIAVIVVYVAVLKKSQFFPRSFSYSAYILPDDNHSPHLPTLCTRISRLPYFDHIIHHKPRLLPGNLHLHWLVQPGRNNVTDRLIPLHGNISLSVNPI